MFDVIHLWTGYDAEYVAKNVPTQEQAEQIAEEFKIKMQGRVWHGQPCVVIRPVPPCRLTPVAGDGATAASSEGELQNLPRV